MLKPVDVFSGFSVDDAQVARQFYERTLGLQVDEGPMGLLEIRLPRGGHAIAYPKPNHQPATFTVLNIVVADIERTVDDLVSNGVAMQRYDNPDMPQDEKGIMRGEGPSIAWFTDPAGNVMAVIEADNPAPATG